LIDGKVVFRARKVNRMDQPEGTAVRLFVGHLTSQGLFPLDLRIATSLRISLLNEIAFHLKILSYAASFLQEKTSYGIQISNSKHLPTRSRFGKGRDFDIRILDLHHSKKGVGYGGIH
jgi:hypothetical protein